MFSPWFLSPSAFFLRLLFFTGCGIVSLTVEFGSSHSSRFLFSPSFDVCATLHVAFSFVEDCFSTDNFFFFTLKGLGPLGPLFFFVELSADAEGPPTRVNSDGLGCKAFSSICHTCKTMRSRLITTYRGFRLYSQVAGWLKHHYWSVNMNDRDRRYPP